MTFRIVVVGTEEHVAGPFTSGADAAPIAAELNNGYAARGESTRVRIVREESAPDAPAPEADILVWGEIVPYHRPTADRIWYSSSAAASWPIGGRAILVTEAGWQWRQRESARVYGGDYYAYAALPWRAESWWLSSDAWTTHYPHPADKDPAKVAYTPSEEYGAADRQIVTRPGAYLQKFFGSVLSPDEIQHWALEWSNRFAPCDLHYAATADEIQHVYENGPSSCMSYPGENYAGGVHPTRAYAGPDLQVAYIRCGDDITGRAVVWPERKRHTRIYGDIERMREALQRAGYVNGEQSLAGARLSRLETGGGGFHCPYIDRDYNVTDTGDYLVIDPHGEIRADNTDGTASCGPEYTCEGCGAGLDADDTYSPANGEGIYCESCYHDMFRYCEHCENDVHYMDHHGHVPGLGEVCNDCRDHYATECVECNEYHAISDVIEGPDSEYRCETCYADAVSFCETHESEYIAAEGCPDCADESEDESEDAPAPPAGPTPPEYRAVDVVNLSTGDYTHRYTGPQALEWAHGMTRARNRYNAENGLHAVCAVRPVGQDFHPIRACWAWTACEGPGHWEVFDARGRFISRVPRHGEDPAGLARNQAIYEVYDARERGRTVAPPAPDPDAPRPGYVVVTYPECGRVFWPEAEGPAPATFAEWSARANEIVARAAGEPGVEERRTRPLRRYCDYGTGVRRAPGTRDTRRNNTGRRATDSNPRGAV